MEAYKAKIVEDSLQPLVNGVVYEFEFIDGNYRHLQPEGFANFENRLPMLVDSVRSVGKLVIVSFHNEDVQRFMIHNPRNGYWSDSPTSSTVWCLEYSEEKVNDVRNKIYFNDDSGGSLLFSNEEDYELLVKEMGKDLYCMNIVEWNKLLDENEDLDITVFLMNQNKIAGIGNRTKNEILHYAKLYPKIISKYTQKERERLYEAITVIPRMLYNIEQGVSIDFDGIYENEKAVVVKTPDKRNTYVDPELHERNKK